MLRWPWGCVGRQQNDSIRMIIMGGCNGWMLIVRAVAHRAWCWSWDGCGSVGSIPKSCCLNHFLRLFRMGILCQIPILVHPQMLRPGSDFGRTSTQESPSILRKADEIWSPLWSFVFLGMRSYLRIWLDRIWEWHVIQAHSKKSGGRKVFIIGY